MRPDKKQDLSGKQSKGDRRIIYLTVKITNFNMCGDIRGRNNDPGVAT